MFGYIVRRKKAGYAEGSGGNGFRKTGWRRIVEEKAGHTGGINLIYGKDDEVW
ncbi:hypothetical protein BACCAP_01689 [Pseudoflavonifractor capillosus ATCC 29799]|uniref:Uncharacterized protein n=1 Tax=Pseudoflavonifractor capillosus ATCC 29799 TaxID=411467 RepID=A6NU09_9FIRM|nr:hypothetical protein BACCAP_01689 [Pseudoflavonifractor capillosus ATCC 29799]